MPYKNPKQQAAIAISMKKAGKTPKEISKHMKSGGTVTKKKTKSKVNESGNYTKPTMRKKLFSQIKSGGSGGAPGQWSARKAQMLAKQYKAKGGGYRG